MVLIVWCQYRVFDYREELPTVIGRLLRALEFRALVAVAMRDDIEEEGDKHGSIGDS